jgi:hypothetical protein
VANLTRSAAYGRRGKRRGAEIEEAVEDEAGARGELQGGQEVTRMKERRRRAASGGTGEEVGTTQSLRICKPHRRETRGQLPLPAHPAPSASLLRIAVPGLAKGSYCFLSGGALGRRRRHVGVH